MNARAGERESEGELVKNAYSPAGNVAALRIVAIYAVVAALWIYLSDTGVGLLTSDPAVLYRLAVVKGLLFIVVTGALLYLLISRYITEQKKAQETREATIELLRICNRVVGLRELMSDLMQYFQRVTGCEAVGVRIQEGYDFPYFETRGFPAEFVEVENSLCAHDQAGELIRDSVGHPAYECMCGNIICGRFDPSKTYFTTRGSFWTNCTTELLANTTDDDRRARTRNRCNGEGYESVALIPLRVHDEIFGLFQFNDKRRDRFTPEKIALLEDLVDYVSIAFAKLKADDALMEATHRLRLAIDSGRFGIWDRDILSGTLLWDDRMLEIYGMDRDSFTGRYEAWQKMVLPDDLAGALEANQAALRGEREYDAEFRIVHPDGTIKNIKASGIVIRDENGEAMRMIGLNQDITDRKLIEEQLRQSQKMEAIGQLAGGVAHDFNNILTAIYGYCYLLQSGTENHPSLRASVEQLYAAAERAANLTHSLLAFSRKQAMCLRSINLNDHILNVGKLLTRIIGEDIQLQTVFQVNPLMIYADGGQIEQVLMNLAANARDAMPNGGLLTIETGIEEIGEDFIHAHGFGEPGRYVVMSVSDAGEGMDTETVKRIFEPFFTTKEVGKGTGLGLSIVYGVIKQHNGFISVRSEPGKGTTFRIHLPLDTEGHAESEEDVDLDYPRMGSETVLVAEDDASMRQFADSILRKFGYDVIFAQDGVDAVEKFKANSEKIDIVIMDMIMPARSGKEAHEEIRRIRPDVLVLFMSGYSPDLLYAKGILEDIDEILVKPIKPLELVRKVRSMLDGNKPGFGG
jgi:PAS domain S-box-containing protein